MTAGERDLLIQLFLQVSVSLQPRRCKLSTKQCGRSLNTRKTNLHATCHMKKREEKCFQINPGMKSKDQTQSLKKKRWRGIQKLWTFAVFTAWTRLGDACTHTCAHGIATHSQKEIQHGALSCLNPPKQGFDLVGAIRLLSVGTCSWSFFFSLTASTCTLSLLLMLLRRGAWKLFYSAPHGVKHHCSIWLPSCRALNNQHLPCKVLPLIIIPRDNWVCIVVLCFGRTLFLLF